MEHMPRLQNGISCLLFNVAKVNFLVLTRAQLDTPSIHCNSEAWHIGGDEVCFSGAHLEARNANGVVLDHLLLQVSRRR